MDRFEKRLLAGAFLFSVGMVAHYVLGSGQLLDLALFGVAYLIIGYDVLLRAARNIGHGNFLRLATTCFLKPCVTFSTGSCSTKTS